MKLFRNLDTLLIFPVLAIFVMGVTILFSIAPDLARTQLFFGFIGFIVLVLVSNIDYRIYPKLRGVFYVFSLLFLAVTFFVGEVTRGSIRWIDFGFVKLQPSEIIKPLLLVFAAAPFLKQNLTIRQFALNSILFFIPVAFVLKQPDLGSSLVYFSMFMGLLFVSGFKPVLTPVIGVCIVIVMPLFWQLLKDYQRERILSFINPGSDPLGIGYNVIQAVIAVGSGSLFGRGVGRGTQSHLLFLPEYYTDFIFASFAEELGFISVFVLIVLYILLLLRIINIAFKSGDSLGFLLCFGVFFIIFVQVVVNIGMNIGLLPITGITLPFLSYGGSSLLSLAILIGLVSGISKSRKDSELSVIR